MESDPTRHFENFRFNESGISQQEQAIITQITDADRARLQDLQKTNLSKDKARIVGIRSEDIFFFLQCVHQGYIPAGQSKLMAKNEAFYLTANPESAYIQAHPDAALFFFPDDNKFINVSTSNADMYGSIGIRQGLHRNIMPFVNTVEFLHQATGYTDPETASLEWERVYGELVNEISAGIRSEADRVLPKHVRLLFQHLLSNSPDRKQLVKFVSRLKNRGSITMAFNEEMFQNYTALPPEQADGFMNAELAFEVPNGKIPLDCVLGFETLGDFEDEILEGLLEE